ncbi:MAG: hypothetical protein Q9198_003166 [Flavoplaca austrocitrina]
MDAQRVYSGPDDLRKLTESLEANVKILEDINGRVNSSMLQLEKALKKYIAEVKDGERANSIMSSVSSSSTTSIMGQKGWRLIQKELESVGITAAQFIANREKVLRILSDAFQEDVAGKPSTEIKQVGQLTRLLSGLFSRGKDLLAAVEEGNVTKAMYLLSWGVDVNTQDSRGCTPLLVAVRKQNFELTKLLLSYKADLHKSETIKTGNIFSMSESPLMWAVTNGDVKTINLLLDHGANINQLCVERMEPIHDTAKHKDIGDIGTLYDFGTVSGAKIITKSPEFSTESFQGPSTALEMAIHRGSFDIVITLVKHRCDVNQTFEGGTPLSLAIRKGELRIIQYLLQNNAHVDTVALLTAVEVQNIGHLGCLLTHHEKAGGLMTDLSTLALAAGRAGKEDALCLLLDKGADVNASLIVEGTETWRNYLYDDLRTTPAGGETLVWFAAAAGKYRLLSLLLAKGADTEKRAHAIACMVHSREHCLFAEQDVHGCTAIQIAVSHGHWDCARLLVRHGGDLNAWVHPPLMYWHERYHGLLHLVIKAPVNPMANLQVLADMGADPNLEDPDGQTPLHITSKTTFNIDRADRVTMARILVKNGARVNCQDKRGVTPLHHAVRRVPKDDELIDFLLKNGARVNCQDKRGVTPLHHAVRRVPQDDELIDFLLKNGADPSIKDSAGYTPLRNPAALLIRAGRWYNAKLKR